MFDSLNLLITQYTGATPFAVLAMCAVIALSSVIRSITGWAFSILSVPLLSLVFDPSTAVVLTLLLSIVATVREVPKIRSDVSPGVFLPLMVGGMAAAPLGYLVHTYMLDSVLRLCIAAIVLTLSLVMMLAKPKERALTFAWLLLAGSASGFLGGLAGIAGPPALLLFILFKADMSKTRTTMGVGLFLISSIAAISYALGGRIHAPMLVLFAIATPIVMLGDHLGRKIFAKFGAESSKKLSIVMTFGVALLNLWLGLRGILS